MSLTQEAEIGKTILMAFPDRMIEEFFYIYDMKDAKVKRDWMDYIDFNLYTSEPNAEHSYVGTDEAGARTDFKKVWRYFLLPHLTVVREHLRDKPLSTEYLYTSEDFATADLFKDAILNRRLSFDHEEVAWVTPHLAGLPKVHAENLLTTFLYNKDTKTYDLCKVKQLRKGKERREVKSIHFFRLVWLYLGELSRKDSRGENEGDGFLKFVKRLSVSKDKKEEKLSRYSRTLLTEFGKMRQQTQSPSSTVH